MAKNEKLFELIKALDKQEKRYVQLYLKRSAGPNGSNYLRLFAAIEKQGTYSEQKLRPLIREGAFSVTKHYLYDQVLYALSAYHRGRTIDQRLSDALDHCQLLFEKKLYYQCGKLVRKALPLARAQEKFSRIVELLDMDLRVMHARLEVKELETSSTRYQVEKEHIARQQAQLHYLQKLSYENFVNLKTRWVRNEQKRTDVYDSLLKVREKDLLSSAARIQYYQILSACLFSMNEGRKAFSTLEKLFRLFDREPHLVSVHMNQYIALLNNMNLLLFERYDFERILSNIERMKVLKAPNSERQTRLQERLVNVELNVYKNRGDFEKGRSVLEESERLLNSRKVGEVYRMLFRIDLFTYHFAFGEYRAALKYLNGFFSDSDVKLREDLQKTARLLNMIIHYELKHYDYFESLIRSTKRFFRRIDTLDEMEKLMLAFFPRIVTATSAAERKKGFFLLHQELLRLSRQPLLQETYFQNFGFCEWAKAGAVGSSYAREVAEKYREKMTGAVKK